MHEIDCVEAQTKEKEKRKEKFSGPGLAPTGIHPTPSQAGFPPSFFLYGLAPINELSPEPESSARFTKSCARNNISSVRLPIPKRSNSIDGIFSAVQPATVRPSPSGAQEIAMERHDDPSPLTVLVLDVRACTWLDFRYYTASDSLPWRYS